MTEKFGFEDWPDLESETACNRSGLDYKMPRAKK
jgi:hypothetical protein